MSLESMTYERKTGMCLHKPLNLPLSKPLILDGFLEALTGPQRPDIIAVLDRTSILIFTYILNRREYANL